MTTAALLVLGFGGSLISYVGVRSRPSMWWTLPSAIGWIAALILA